MMMMVVVMMVVMVMMMMMMMMMMTTMIITRHTSHVTQELVSMGAQFCANALVVGLGKGDS